MVPYARGGAWKGIHMNIFKCFKTSSIPTPNFIDVVHILLEICNVLKFLTLQFA